MLNLTKLLNAPQLRQLKAAAKSSSRAPEDILTEALRDWFAAHPTQASKAASVLAYRASN